MVVLGFLLILLGAAAILAALFTAGGSVQFLGLDLTAVSVFFLGVASALAILWGLGILRFGAKRSLKLRKERKELSRLSAKLDRAEAERREHGESEGEQD